MRLFKHANGNTPIMECVVRKSWLACELMQKHLPIINNRNKRVVLDIACPPDAVYQGTVTVSSWRGALPERFDAADTQRPDIELRPGFFTFDPPPDGDAHWHVNFADPNLFVYYRGGLFAQDEMQVAEHPALAVVREAMKSEGIPPCTVMEGQPTPVLVAGVERRVRVATDPNASEGRPNGLYGNAFARADVDAVRRATAVINPPTVSNILAIAAPSGGSGYYTADQIRDILRTACVGFAAARSESAQLGLGETVVVHTGYWGCGAFGGNRTLMSLLQMLAAWIAGVDRLVFHFGDEEDNCAQAFEILDDLRDIVLTGSLDTVVKHIVNLRFEWGVGDGN